MRKHVRQHVSTPGIPSNRLTIQVGGKNYQNAHVMQPPNETVFNPYVIYTDRGKYSSTVITQGEPVECRRT